MSTVFVGWAATEASALISLAGVDSTKASVYYNPFVNTAGLTVDQTWTVPLSSPLGGGLERQGYGTLFVGPAADGNNNPSFTKLGGVGNSWALSAVARVTGLPLTASDYFFMMMGLTSGAGLSIGLYQNVSATKYIAGDIEAGGTTYLSTVTIDENFHRFRMWFNATTNKYFFTVDAETAIQIAIIAPLTAATRCPICFMTNSVNSRQYCMNRFLFVSGSEV